MAQFNSRSDSIPLIKALNVFELDLKFPGFRTKYLAGMQNTGKTLDLSFK
jgi:hypothetical protein